MFSLFFWGRMVAAMSLLAALMPAPAISAQSSPEAQDSPVLPLAFPATKRVEAPSACPVIATNANTAQTFCSIQEANDDPMTQDGHTISVTAGTYTTQTSTITKSLTIIGDGAGVTLDGANATRVMTVTGTIITLTLQNITMTRGNGNGSLYDGDGGCLFARADGGNVALINVTFSSCATANYGGGALIFGNATITASQFISNSANDGGGAYIYGSATITASQFIGNSAGSVGGGAVIFVATITASQFVNNTAQNGGGALIGIATITTSQFVNNTAQNGGGAYFFYGKGSVANSLFARNTATRGAGDAIYSCDPEVYSCDSLNIAFTTIASPTLAAGSAVFVGTGSDSTLNMTNTIIVNHAVGINNTGTVNEDFNYFDGNTTNIGGGGTTTSGANHPSGAQAFANPAGDDWRLVMGNPAINTGTDVGVYTDYFGAVRPSGGGFDIGYHELGFGTVIVQKVVMGTPPTAPWAFSIPTGTVNLPAAGGSIVLMGQVAGSYFITETAQSGFVPTASCTNGASGTNGVTFDLAANAVITCTFTNTAFTPTPTPTPGSPTAIELAGFYAETASAAKCGNPSGAECVSVFWQTLREANTAGFVLLRGDAADGRAGAQEVSGFIQSEGSSGANYAWQDTSTQAGHTYAYWLREMGLDGSTRDFGPVYAWVDGAVK